MPDFSTSDSDGSLNIESKRIEEEIDGKNIGDNSSSPPAATDTSQALPVSQLFTIVAAVSLAGFLYSLDITIITTVSYYAK